MAAGWPSGSPLAVIWLAALIIGSPLCETAAQAPAGGQNRWLNVQEAPTSPAAPSYGEPPRPRQGEGSPPQNQAPEGAEGGARDDEGAPDVAAPVTLTEPVEAQEEAADIAQQQQNEASPDWWMVGLTALLVAVAAAQWIAMIIQARRLRETVDLARDTTERQLRAYVCQVAGWLKFDRKEAPEAHIVIKNCGLTPAYNVRTWVAMWIGEYRSRKDFSPPPAGFQMSTAVLAPGLHHTITVQRNPPLNPQQIALLGRPAGTVYIYGEVRYRDAFGIERHTAYRLLYRGARRDKEGRLVPDTEGNEASWEHAPNRGGHGHRRRQPGRISN